MALPTAFTERFGIEHPIVQAGMRGVSPDLAAIVAEAGALGTLPGSGVTPEAFEANIARLAELTSRPFSLNLMTFPWAPHWDQSLDVALHARPASVTVSFGDPIPSLLRFKAAGITVIVQVQDLETARRALANGADAIIVQGTEGGGHTGRRGTLSFTAQVLDLAGDTPILVAGGVANGRGLAAAIAMGAAGVVMGTRFKATLEFAASPEHKQAMLDSDGSNTLYDPRMDTARGGRWPNGVAGRVLRNQFTEEWEGREPELEAEVAKFDDPLRWIAEYGTAPERKLNWAGEASGLVHELLPAAEVVSRTVAEAETWLANAARLLHATQDAKP